VASQQARPGGKLETVTVINRADLAAFLRARRARVSPHDAGLPEMGRRRTPGLRRQEVAQLAGLSVDYYIRLEQGRGPNPSRQVMSALARALMLTADERDYLFRMTGHTPPQTAPPSREITPGIRHLLDSMPSTPAYVVDAAYNVLAWNQIATHFIGNLAGYRDRNMIRWTFRRPPVDTVWDDAHFVRFTRATVADLRANYAAYPGDPEIERLVTEMLALSPRFAEMWATQDVETRGPMVKHVDHPEAGPLEFECQMLHIAGTGQRLITYCAAPGSPTAEAFVKMAAQPMPRAYPSTGGNDVDRHRDRTEPPDVTAVHLG
jgi:transcriptional regulator with XRE-family HTH domain